MEEQRAYLDSLKRDFNDYKSYLASIKNRLPQGDYEFAVADWHYDSTNPKWPHDAWIQEIKIKEIAEGERNEIRKIQIEIILLGAYHDRLLKVTYEDVSTYSIMSANGQTHGDWIVDEISLSEAGLVVHEIKFRHGSFLKFEVKNLRFEEQLSSTPYSAVWVD